jgi:hypothetical protein
MNRSKFLCNVREMRPMRREIGPSGKLEGDRAMFAIRVVPWNDTSRTRPNSESDNATARPSVRGQEPSIIVSSSDSFSRCASRGGVGQSHVLRVAVVCASFVCQLLCRSFLYTFIFPLRLLVGLGMAPFKSLEKQAMKVSPCYMLQRLLANCVLSVSCVRRQRLGP